MSSDSFIQKTGKKHVPVLTTELRSAILASFHAAQIPPHGPAYHDWLVRAADELACSQPQCRRVIAEYQGQLQSGVGQSVGTMAQQIADMMGATMVQAFAVLEKGLLAEDVSYLRDGAGNLVKEDGHYVKIRKPLWATRLKAVENTLKVHGAFAPQQVNVNELKIIANITDGELFNRIDALQRNLAILTRDTAAALGGTRSLSAGSAGEKGDSGQVVLADRVYEDEGRTGSDEPLQELSE